MGPLNFMRGLCHEARRHEDRLNTIRTLIVSLLWLAAGSACAQAAAPQSAFIGVPFVAGAPLLQQPLFEFPSDARLRKSAGTVVVAFLVGEDGVPLRHRIIAADPPLLFEAAVNASAGEFRFAPATRDGKPAQYETHVTLSFAGPSRPAPEGK